MKIFKEVLWSSLFLDYSLHKNFNVGFASHKNDIHIHLSQWQYWWWFWFALVWTLYFFVILKLYYNKTENYNITLNTSLRSHGKWGDFLVALIPLSWCGNILINSNFILRMLEWQNESSLFTIRIQGKQWYWSYKFSSDTDFRLKSVYINVGNNNWVKNSSQSDINFNRNSSVLSFIYDAEFKRNHEKAISSKLRSKSILKKNNLSGNNVIIPNHNFELSNYDEDFNNILPNINNNFKKLLNNVKIKFENNNIMPDFKSPKDIINYRKVLWIKKYEFEEFVRWHKGWDAGLKNKFDAYDYESLKFFDNDSLDEVEESAENLRVQHVKYPIRLIKGVLTKHNISLLQNNAKLEKNILLNYNIISSDITDKIGQSEQFWGFRQKRYKKLRMFSFAKNKRYDNKTYTHIENFTNKADMDKYNLYTGVRNNKYKSEMIPVTLARRLLRTKRTLVLPAHINITLITNSYDVVHSWFVPGLGLKIDCVPGRSTHHSLYIDNIGFYYGQCAEICGRYHHHMPIRVCALTFEHFMLWWQTRGLPRMYRSESFQENKSVLLHKFR